MGSEKERMDSYSCYTDVFVRKGFVKFCHQVLVVSPYSGDFSRLSQSQLRRNVFSYSLANCPQIILFHVLDRSPRMFSHHRVTMATKYISRVMLFREQSYVSERHETKRARASVQSVLLSPHGSMEPWPWLSAE